MKNRARRSLSDVKVTITHGVPDAGYAWVCAECRDRGIAGPHATCTDHAALAWFVQRHRETHRAAARAAPTMVLPSGAVVVRAE